VNPELAEIADLVRRETGIVLPAAREAALRAAVERTAPGLGAAAFARATSDPAGGRDLVARLIDEVTNQETFFVRDRGQLDEIPWHALLQRARAANSGTIRVWCAGCATGEEAYTLALLAAQAFAPAGAEVDVLGTDVSHAALASAADGRYRERAVRALEPRLRSRYFHRAADGSYVVGDLLRSLVRFRPHNLARDASPPPGEACFDFITCRNVLIYFSPPLVSAVIDSLEGALRPGGTLILEDLQDTQIREGDPTISVISRVVQAVRPTVIYTHSLHDVHQDHRNAHQAAMVATRGVGGVYCFQSPSATVDFRPTRFVSIDDHVERKLAAIKAFASQTEVRAYLVPDLIRSTARYWSRYGDGLYAEAFEVIREAPTTTGQPSDPRPQPVEV
jgi:chemotaxis methyl-accepting protein methylase